MKYRVVFESFAETHFAKTFARKYKGAWDTTREGLLLEFSLFDLLFDKSIAETISVSRDGVVRVCKTEFRIAGTNVSRHASGNRCIVAVDSEQRTVRVLLVYAKTDLRGKHETAAWMKLVKSNYDGFDFLN